jgi:hypothetical protein
VVDEVVSRGAKPENIRIIAVVVAPPAMVKLSEKYKGERTREGVDGGGRRIRHECRHGF